MFTYGIKMKFVLVQEQLAIKQNSKTEGKVTGYFFNP